VRRVLFLLLVSTVSLIPGRTQEKPSPQFLAGNVIALSESKVTVRRIVLGKESDTRTFTITPETRIEGKLRLKARVTVQYVTDDDGDRALHIIVRSSPKK
jgi:hypothetical protein